MHILNVNSTLGLKTGGGTAERTFQMSHFLAAQGVQCTVLTLDIELDKQRVADLAPAALVALPFFWKRYYVPWTKWKNIKKAVESADVIHMMGHWGILNAFVYLAARFTKKPYVICPAGALPLFGRSKSIKRIYNWIIGYAIVQNASAWIAVTKSEFPQFKAYGIDESKITVIPNGVNVADFPLVENQAFTKKYKLQNKPIILFLGRLNLIKGPDILMEAFIQAQDCLKDFQLVFVGPDGGMLPMLQQRAEEAGITDKVSFIGYVDGYDKSAAYQAAELLVVPSRQEAMSIVALESMVCGTPVLLTDQCGFGEVKSFSTNLEASTDVKDIKDKMILLLENKKALNEVARSLQRFAIDNYSWQEVIQDYQVLYSKIMKNKK